MSADFLTSYRRLGPKEGGYAHDPDDAGGETWKGIARNREPGNSWLGWQIVDAAKSDPTFPANLAGMVALEGAVQEFYRDHFWPALAPQLPQAVADELFEAGVNCGLSNGVRFLQTALNVLNRNQQLYPDIDTDGSFGGATLGAALACLQSRGEKVLLKFMNQVQGNYYMDLLLRRPEQEKFALSWFNRVA